MTRSSGASVLVAGLGDLGARVLDQLAADPRLGRLVGAGRATRRAEMLVAQAALIADAVEGPRHVEHRPVDLGDRGAVATLLRDVRPDVVVFAASRHSWWRTAPAATSLPYAVWLPLQVTLLRTFMQAHRDVAATARVVTLPHPDVAGPMLAAEGLAPHVGAGNVAEVAAKLRMLVTAERRCHRRDVEVHLVLHHAAERLAFSVFDRPHREPEASRHPGPPYLAEATVGGEPVEQHVVERLLRSPYPLPPGAGSHQLTAATTVRLVHALLGDEPQRLHAPAPGGLPGGYPVTVSSGAVRLDLPPSIATQDAVAVNERAAAHEGVASVEEDGTLLLTPEASAAALAVLGLQLHAVPPSELDTVADELERAAAALGTSPPTTPLTPPAAHDIVTATDPARGSR